MANKALITGITGQDGSYLAEFLLSKGYEVHGFIRRSSSFNTSRIAHLFTDPHEPVVKLHLHYADLSDGSRLTNLIHDIQPDEVYNLGAQSHVRVSFDMPEYTGHITALGTTRLLEVIRRSNLKIKFYQASSSEMFGSAPPPQSESTPFQPRNPYAVAKLYSYWMTVNYRLGYQLFACNGILFNHESPRRGETFVTRKITRAIAEILAGRQKDLYVGNLETKRDWGYAPEYTEAMWLIMQHEEPDDYVLGTGECHSVQEFVEEAFGYVKLDWRQYVKIDSRYFRPTETEYLQADCKKASDRLGWKPKVKFKELVRIMVDADMEAANLKAPGEGKDILKKARPEH